MKRNLLCSAILLATPAAFAQIAADSANDNLEQITVTASRVGIPRAQTGVTVSVLTAADIEKLGYSTLLDVVKTLPGIAVSNSGGLGKVSNVYVRGESGYRTLVLLDGVNIADPTNTQVTTQFQHLLADDVERIEVLRGPQGMMYGAGAGGVINIVTKRASQPVELQLGAEAGRYNTHRTRASVRGELNDWQYGLQVSRLQSDGFNAREDDSSGERDGYDNQTVSARLGYAVSENFALRGQVRQVSADTGFDGCYAGWTSTNNCEDQYTQTSYLLAADMGTGNAAHRLSISSQQLERDSLAEGASSFAVEGAIDEVNYFGNVNLTGGALSWGADLDEQDYVSGSSTQSLDILGVYGEWRGDLAQTVYYTVGYRHDQLDEENHNSWRVTAAIPQLIGDNQQIRYRASASTGFRAPSPFEISYNLAEGVAPLGPEKSRGYELGIEYHWQSLLQLELVAFRQTVTDAIIFDSFLGSGWGAYGQDDGESESDGYELSLNGNLGESGRWYANGTWLDSVDSAGAQRLNVPKRQYNLGASYTLGAVTLAGNWQRAEDRLSPNPDWLGSPLPQAAYNKLDLNAVYAYSKRLAFSVRGENLLDEDYSEVAGFHTAGAAIYAGVEFSLN